MRNHHLVVSSALQYIRDTVCREPAEFAAIRQRIAKAGELPIHIGAEEGRLLQFLIKLGGYRKIVEIGTHAAYSTMFMAQALGAAGELVTLESDARRIALARETLNSFNSGGNLKCKVTLLEGKAMDTLSNLRGGPFDMVFIDADKLSYAKYLDWAENNVRVGGLIVGDNTFLHGAVHGGEESQPPQRRVSPSALRAMREFNTRLGDETKFLGVMLPTVEGWTMGIKL